MPDKVQSESRMTKGSPSSSQFSTFYMGDRLFGIDVMQVQEITRTLPITQIPLAPSFVKGLINLRGQLATAIELRELFKIEEPSPKSSINVVCRWEGLLLSFLVDRIGDVIEVENKYFESSPDTVPESIRQFMQGVYKVPGQLLSIVEVPKITVFLNK